jgi:hypothetical protein
LEQRVLLEVLVVAEQAVQVVLVAYLEYYVVLQYYYQPMEDLEAVVALVTVM